MAAQSREKDMDDLVASHLAAACSRSAVHAEAFFPLREAFPHSKLLRWGVCGMLRSLLAAEQGGAAPSSHREVTIPRHEPPSPTPLPQAVLRPAK